MGDQNADPFDGDSVAAGVPSSCSRTRGSTPPHPDQPGRARAGRPAGRGQPHPTGATGLRHRRFLDVPGPGNLRVDYVLPSKNLRILDGAVFWPLSATRCSGWSACSRSRPPTTAWSGSMCACTGTARPPGSWQRLLLGWAAAGEIQRARGGRRGSARPPGALAGLGSGAPRAKGMASVRVALAEDRPRPWLGRSIFTVASVRGCLGGSQWL